MSSQRAKAIRKALKPIFAPFALGVRSAVHVTSAVPSRKYSVQTQDKEGHVEVLKDRALQVTLHPESPRAVYQKAKVYAKQRVRTEASGSEE